MTLYDNVQNPLPARFSGAVFIGGDRSMGNQEMWVGFSGCCMKTERFKGILESKDLHNAFRVDSAFWASDRGTTSYLVKLSSANQSDIFAALSKGFKDLGLIDVAIVGILGEKNELIIWNLRHVGILPCITHNESGNSHLC